MLPVIRLLLLFFLPMLIAGTANATPEKDARRIKQYYAAKFPSIPFENFKNGVYAIDSISRESWEAIEEFPPYEPFIDDGETLFNMPFKNGKNYADCFDNKGIGIANQYPHWDKKSGMVVTLAMSINDCRKSNGEKPLPYGKGDIAAILAYMAYTTRGKKINVVIPAEDPRALDAYNNGKSIYFTRRGQLNFACAHCHMLNVGKHIRTDVLSPSLGHATGWPVYRSMWGDLGTIQRRFRGCFKQVRAKPYQLQGEEYRNLEYFLTYISNGLPHNGPSSRK